MIDQGIEKFHIWGQGKGHGEHFWYKNFDINFYLIRGETTRKALDLPDDIPTGDPGFIMPELLPIKPDKSFGITYAPHNQNRKHHPAKCYKMGCDDYFDVMIHRAFFVDRLKRLIRSKFVLTNSLHVAILCRAYNVPFAVSLLDGEKFSFPTKWDDIFDWLGVELEIVKDYKSGLKWWNKNIKGTDLPDTKHILKTLPKEIFK